MSLINNLLNQNSDKLSLLNQLTHDKITLEILREFYLELHSRAVTFNVPGGKIFDVCGTGGSGRTRFNLSTALAFTLSKNLTIAKHANRASSGKVGSVDVLSELGIEICQNPDDAIHSIANNNFAFLLAPAFHPSLQSLSQARKDFGKPTIFNFVMPMLNPVKNLAGQMIGVSQPEVMFLMAEIANELGKNILFVHDLANNLDDVSITGETLIIEVLKGKIKEYRIKPNDLNFHSVKDFNMIQGFSDIKQNTQLFKDVLQGNAPREYIEFLGINEKVAKIFFAKL